MTRPPRLPIYLIAYVTIALASLPAHATGNTWCDAKQDDTSISLLTGRLPVLHVLSADITYDGVLWSTENRDSSKAMAFGQGMMENRRLAVDFVDPNVERILFSLRVDFTGHDAEAPVAGKLTGNDGKVVDVLCQGDG